MPFNVISRYNLHPVDKTRFWGKPLRHSSASENPDPYILLVFLPEHSGRYTFRTWQINHLAELLKIIELSSPIRPYGEYIHIIFLNVIYLLPYIILNDYLVCISGVPDRLHAFQYIIPHIEFSPLAVETVISDTDNQVVSKFLGPTQQVYMPLMQQVVCAVCNYFFHRYDL